MVRRLIISALALAFMSSVAAAQSMTKDDEAIQQMPQQLRDKLTAQGYSDVKIAPGSYIVSAKDKDGNRVMMMIGPTSMTMMKVPDQNPSQAQTPSGKDEIIQQ